jgi:alpha-galactosidase
VAARVLQDHSVAVGLFNRGSSPANIGVRWADLGLEGKLRVRDLWAHQDLGSMADGFQAPVPKHGVVLITVRR